MFSGIIKESELNILSSLQPVEEAKAREMEFEAAYYLIKLKNATDFFPVFNSLGAFDNVVRISATKGECEILFVVEKPEPGFETKICSLEGVGNVTRVQLKSVYSTKDEKEKKKVSSVIVMLANSGMLEKIAAAMLQSDYVNVCYAAEGKYNLIAEVSADSFAETDKFVANHVVSLDGVLKVKELPIINLYE